jgi:hypothetical protein
MTLASEPPLLIVLGSLSTAFGAVVTFWLGSNKCSIRTKNDWPGLRRSGCSGDLDAHPYAVIGFRIVALYVW